jgi:hypothetical protein
VKTATPELQALITEQIIAYSLTLADWRSLNPKDLINRIKIPMSGEEVMQMLIMAVLRAYSIELGEDLAILDPKKVMRFIGESVIRNTRNGVMNKSNFENEMEGQLPPGLKVEYECLRGLFVTHKDSLIYVNEESLPITFADRLAALLKIQRGWESSEIEPFLEWFVPGGMGFGDFLARYARLADGLWMQR